MCGRHGIKQTDTWRGGGRAKQTVGQPSGREPSAPKNTGNPDNLIPSTRHRDGCYDIPGRGRVISDRTCISDRRWDFVFFGMEIYIVDYGVKLSG